MRFTNILAVAAKDNSGPLVSYLVTDTHPVDGYNYYRIKSVEMSGRTEYTSVVKVLMGKGKQEIAIYPNPFIEEAINIQLNNMPEGEYGVILLNSRGQKVLDRIIQHIKGSSTELISVDKNLPHGIYQLRISKPGGEVVTNKLVH